MAPDTYQLRFPSIVDAVMRSDYALVVDRADEIDLTSISGDHNSRLLAIAPLVVSCLILDQTPSARFALVRLSDHHGNHPLTKLLSSLLQATTNRNHPKVYENATAVVDLVSQPGFFNQDLALVLTKLTTVFMDRFRMRTFELLSKAYRSLPLSIAESYLGCSSEAVLSEAANNGWDYDRSTQTLIPTASGLKLNSVDSASSTLSTLGFITDSVAKLEA